jgi:hypothetical protein
MTDHGLSRQKTATPKRRFQFNERPQLFIRMHNETLSVIAVCVCNPDCSPVGINRFFRFRSCRNFLRKTRGSQTLAA